MIRLSLLLNMDQDNAEFESIPPTKDCSFPICEQPTSVSLFDFEIFYQSLLQELLYIPRAKVREATRQFLQKHNHVLDFDLLAANFLIRHYIDLFQATIDADNFGCWRLTLKILCRPKFSKYINYVKITDWNYVYMLLVKYDNYTTMLELLDQVNSPLNSAIELAILKRNMDYVRCLIPFAGDKLNAVINSVFDMNAYFYYFAYYSTSESFDEFIKSLPFHANKVNQQMNAIIRGLIRAEAVKIIETIPEELMCTINWQDACEVIFEMSSEEVFYVCAKYIQKINFATINKYEAYWALKYLKFSQLYDLILMTRYADNMPYIQLTLMRMCFQELN